MDQKKLYPLAEILLVELCGRVHGAQSWRDFVTFGEEKLDYLRRFCPLRMAPLYLIGQPCPEQEQLLTCLVWIKNIQLYVSYKHIS